MPNEISRTIELKFSPDRLLWLSTNTNIQIEICVKGLKRFAGFKREKIRAYDKVTLVITAAGVTTNHNTDLLFMTDHTTYINGDFIQEKAQVWLMHQTETLPQHVDAYNSLKQFIIDKFGLGTLVYGETK